MDHRERFLDTLQFQPVDHVPNLEIAVWQQTYDRWRGEGMPEEAMPRTGLMHGNTYFSLEGIEVVNFDALGPRPAYAQTTISEDDEHILFVDRWGRTRRALKTGTVRGQRMSMDTYVDFPVKDRASFLAHRRRYEGDPLDRYPGDWEAIKARVTSVDKPRHILDPLAGTFGFYSMLRNWMGTEGVSYLLYDDRSLVYDCLEFLCDYIIKLLSKALTEIQFDFYYIHEDMCYKNGPLVSPKLFRELFSPFYRRLTGFLHSHGLQTILVDTDGNHELLTPLFLEVGVDGFGPIERAAGMDPVAVRKQYGRSVCMVGGVDKREIAAGKQAIERELDRLAPLLELGGFVPTIDHAVPPDVSYENFLYYLELKRDVLAGRRRA